VKKDAAQNVIEAVNKDYYDANSLPRSAAVFSPSCGSSVFY
jgi:hypothetical protein